MPISTRKNFKLLGVALLVLGILTVAYAALFMGSLSYNIEVGGMDSEPRVVSGQTPFQRLVVGFTGALMVFLGYKSYRYIPPSEREKEMISEFDLYREED